MWRSKKFIIIAVLVAVVLIGTVGGVALAQTGDEDNNSQTQQEALLDKVCAIYEQNTGTTIDAQALKDAFAQAQSEMQNESLDRFLQSLVDEGKITQEEADQYKAWLESKPDIGIPIAAGLPGYGMHRGFGGPGGEFPDRGEPQPTESAE
jgi:hypothetical protein